MTHVKDTERCFDKLEELKKSVEGWAEAASKMPMESVDAAELGEVVDMVKDLTQAQKDIWESCYYKTVVDGMLEGEDGSDRMGYSRDSRGRFSRQGYEPGMDMAYRMGYEAGRSSGNSSGSGRSSGSSGRMGYAEPLSSMGRMMGQDGLDGYGQEFGRYRQARRRYTETMDPSEKRKMEDHAEHHMNESLATIREIWKEADPQLRQKLKQGLERLMGELN